MIKKTVGQKVNEIREKGFQSINLRETSHAMGEKHQKDLMETFDLGQAQYSGSFFIEVIFKKEKFFDEMVRNYMVVKEACPRPIVNQSLYHFDHQKGELELWWHLPPVAVAITLWTHPEFCGFDKASIERLKTVQAFYGGDLIRKSHEYNCKIVDTTLRPSFDRDEYDKKKGKIILA